MGKKERKHNIGKRIMACLIAVIMLLPLKGMDIIAVENESKVSDSVTRLEWLLALMNAFDFTIPFSAYDFPDNYYTDIKNSNYYVDVMLATEFGLLDVEEGGEARLNDAATREFAAHTLNLCLGYVLEEKTYTFSEAGTVTYPEDIQVAINQGWLTLVDGDFLPDQPVTKSEKESMINYAKKIVAKDKEVSGSNTYIFKEGVIVLPEETVIDSLDGDRFSITDCPVAIQEGKIFGKVCDGIPLAWKAVKVETSGRETIITIDMVNSEDAFDKIDINQEKRVDLENLQPASADVQLNYIVGGTEAGNYEDGTIYETLEDVGEEEITAVLVEQTVDMPTVSENYNVGDAKIKINAKISDLNYKTNYKAGSVYIDFTFKVDFSCNVNADLLAEAGISPNYELFHVQILPGVYVKGLVDLSFFGGANIRFVEDVKLGFHYENSVPRLVRKLKKDSYTVSANTTSKMGVHMEAGFTIPGLSGKIFSKMGANVTEKSVRHMDEQKPAACKTISSYFYASAGYDVRVDVVLYKGTLVSGSKDIYTQYNSPVRTAFHYEDGVVVPKCTRGTSDMGYGGGGYFSPINSQYYCISGSSGSTYENGDIYTIFDYSLDVNNRATITGYRGTAVNVFIPEMIDGYPVVGIGDKAFWFNHYIRSVSIPDCVEVIGGSAFTHCESLERVVLPENEYFTIIESYMFFNCYKLTDIIIPDNVKEIRPGAFKGCISLTRIDIPDGVTIIGSSAFKYCTNLSTVVLSKSLSYLGTGAFEECQKLTAIEIPKSLERGRGNSGPFCKCSNLKAITFEKGTTEIASYLFADCDGLEQIIIPDTVTVIEDSAFYNCENLERITIPDSVAEIGASAFEDCTSLTSITIPDSVTKVGKSAFSGCVVLESAVLPNTLKTIPNNMFQNCTSLKDISLSNRLIIIGSYAFFNCDALEGLVLPDSLTIIGDSAFCDCDALMSIMIPYGTNSIGNSAFCDCDALTTVVVSDTVQTIGSSAFKSCHILTDVTLGASLTSIESETFMDCISLKELVVPYRVEAIGSNAFRNDLKLTTITLPKSVTSIDNTAFSYPKEITFSGVSNSYAQIFAEEKGSVFNAIEVGAETIVLNKECYIYPHDTVELLAIVKPLDFTGDFTWSTSDSNIVSVDGEGRICALKSGNATVTIQAGDKSAECQVEVLVPVNQILVDSFIGGNKMAVNTTHQLQWSILPEDASNKNVTFSSSDEEIASVDEKGLVTAHKVGSADICIKSKDGKTSHTISLTITETLTSEEPVVSENPQYLLGDVNNDKEIDLEDALLALKGALQIVRLDKQAEQAADVDHNTKIELNDALLILKKALRIINSFEDTDN